VGRGKEEKRGKEERERERERERDQGTAGRPLDHTFSQYRSSRIKIL
jgi:hypothetical protein